MNPFRLTMMGVLLAALAAAPQARAQGPQTALVGACTFDSLSVEKLTGNTMVAKCTPGVDIPYGKSWVIETASAWCPFDANTTPPAVAQITLVTFRQIGVGTYQASDFVFPDFTSSAANGLNNLLRRSTRGALRGPLYTEIPPTFQVERFSGSVNIAKCSLSAAGYLVDKAVAF